MKTITDHHAQVKLCKHFFENQCKKTKTLKCRFGKSTIEHFLGTYIQEAAFQEALMLTDSKMVTSRKEGLKFDRAINNQFKNKVLFNGWSSASSRWNQIIIEGFEK